MNTILKLFLVVFLLLPTWVFASEIILKSGQKIEGKIIEQTDKYVKIDFDGMHMTYYMDEIESIDAKTVTNEPKPAAVSKGIMNMFFDPKKIKKHILDDPNLSDKVKQEKLKELKQLENPDGSLDMNKFKPMLENSRDQAWKNWL